MRRGQDPSTRTPASEGFTKQQLLDAADLSPKIFDRLRKAARIRGPVHGGLNWVFPPEDVITLIHRAEGGNFSQRGAPAALAWRALLDEHGINVPEKVR